MTTSLDTIRYHSGIAGEEVADMVDSLEQEVSTLREQVEKLTKELSVLKTTPPHLRQDLHCVASDLSAQVRERDEQLTAALAAVRRRMRR